MSIAEMLAEVYLAQSLSKARSCAGAAIEFIENAAMLHNGRYFRKGTKRALDELKQLGLPVCREAAYEKENGADWSNIYGKKHKMQTE